MDAAAVAEWWWGVARSDAAAWGDGDVERGELGGRCRKNYLPNGKSPGMAADSVTSDMGLGLGLLLTVLALAAAAGMLASASQAATAWAFALAVTAGVVAITAMHLFWR